MIEDPEPQYEYIVDDGEPISMDEFTLGPREILCMKCRLVHRPEADCDE